MALLRLRGLSFRTCPVKSQRIAGNNIKRALLTKAYAEGPREPPLLEATVPGHFKKIVKAHGDRTAVVSSHQRQRLSYHELNEKANSLSHGLQDVGVRKGDRVAIMLGNNIEHAIATYAVFKLGAILVPLNPAFGTNQVVSALNHLEASHLIISSETNLAFKPPRTNENIFEQITADISSPKFSSRTVPSLIQVIIVDNSNGRVQTDRFRSFVGFDTLLNCDPYADDPIPEASLDPYEIANIQFTSGTTSMPKAACLTHRSILNNGHQIGSRMVLTPDDCVVCPPPLFHCFGCILGYMATATHGSCIVFPAEAFSPTASLQAVIAEKATALYGVPTMFISELELLASSTRGEYPPEGLAHLRTGIAAGSSIPAELMRKLHHVLNLTELTICYGMTETSPVSLMTTTDDPLEKRINTVGRLMPHVRAKIVDPHDRSRVLNVKERGELVVSGYLTMKGYWHDKERTDAVLTEDILTDDDDFRYWMHTGDEASMDEDGYVAITGRIKDLIIRGGENIHPLEVENCILGHSSVSDVSVVGIPDAKYGETVGAFVILHQNVTATDSLDSELKAYVKHNLSHHLAPRYIFFTSEFPKTASGKIQKFKLREIGTRLSHEGDA